MKIVPISVFRDNARFERTLTNTRNLRFVRWWINTSNRLGLYSQGIDVLTNSVFLVATVRFVARIICLSFTVQREFLLRLIGSMKTLPSFSYLRILPKNERFVSFRFVLFRSVPFRSVPFRFVSFRSVSLRFVSFEGESPVFNVRQWARFTLLSRINEIRFGVTVTLRPRAGRRGVAIKLSL